jgi:hypothetical protein
MFALGAGGLAVGSGCGTTSGATLYGAPACDPPDSSECAPYVPAEASVAAAADGAPDDAGPVTFDGSMIVTAEYGCPPPPPGSGVECPPLVHPDAASDAAADASPETSTVAEAGAVDAGEDAVVGPCGGSFCALYGGPAIGH